jgi:translation initiation factor 2A
MDAGQRENQRELGQSPQSRRSKEATTSESQNRARPATKIALRSEKEIQVYTYSAGAWTQDSLQIQAGGLMQFSDDGQFLAIGKGNELLIFTTEDSELRQRLQHEEDVAAVSFSPKNTFVLTWTRLRTEQQQTEQQSEVNQNKGNLKIWNVATGREIYSFVQKKITPETWPPIRWTEDELISAKMVSSEIHFFTGQKWDEIVRRVKLAGVTNFSLAPGPAPPTIAAFIPEKKGSPGSVRVYKYPRVGEIIASKTLWKAQTAEFYWNRTGTSLLVATRTDVDRTGKSYYGQTNLYFLSIDGTVDCNVPLDAEGPVHHCSWSPDGSQFLVIYGYMPAKATLFDSKCNKLADFGRAPRNTAKWSPCARMLAVAGFGNLNGQVDIWDVKKVQKVGSCLASCASTLDWSPDSKHFLTAVLSPKIRVDNGVTVWRHDGTQVHHHPLDQLYQAMWRPAPPGTYPLVKIKAAKAPASSSASPSSSTNGSPAKPALYVPPSRRGQAAAIAREEEGEMQPRKYEKEKPSLPVGWTPESKAGKRNKPRRQRKKNQPNKDAQAASPPHEAAAKASPEQEGSDQPEEEDGSPLDPIKRKKGLVKKLRQISQLKEKQASGQALNEMQLRKLQSEAALRAELEGLST